MSTWRGRSLSMDEQELESLSPTLLFGGGNQIFEDSAIDEQTNVPES